MRTIGPHSRPHRLALIDGRLAEAKLMAEHRAELIHHCGGKPSATQRALIERATALYLRLHLMDRETIRASGMTERNGREYLAWNNSYSRTVSQLGLQGPREKPPTPAEIMARHTVKGVA